MSREPRGLGKGLSALLGEVPDARELRKPVGYVNKEVAGSRPRADADILRIPIEQIEPNPYQPRMSFDKDALDELADSIRTLGLIQPITVRRTAENRYQIISGERRYKASHQAGLSMIPAYVREADDQGMLEMAIVENVQRQDLDPIEIAMSYQRLMDECALTQEQMASRVGKKRASIANYLRLLHLPVKVQHDLKVGLLSVGHAKAILGLDDAEAQEEICDMTISGGLSVREVEALVRKLLAGEKVKPVSPSEKPSQELPEHYQKVLGHVGKYFTNEISLRRSASGKGSMTIKFASDDEVKAFLKVLEERSI